MGKLIIKQGKVLTPFQQIEDGAVIIEEGKIAAVGSSKEIDKLQLDKEDIEVFDAKGDLVVPGFIEIHRHGLDNWDILEGSGEDMEEMSQALLKQGTIAFLPTIMTAPIPEMRACATMLERAMVNPVRNGRLRRLQEGGITPLENSFLTGHAEVGSISNGVKPWFFSSITVFSF